MTTDSNRAVTDLIGGLTSLSRDAAAMDAATVNIYRALLDDAVRAAALAQVERDDAIAKVDAADQRTRSLDAALTAERETSRGLVAQVDTWRDTWARVETIVDEAFGPFPVWPVYDTICAMERGIHDGIRAAQELAAIRDLVAPGNPQGAVVDAVRAMMHVLGLVREDRDRANTLVADMTTERDAAVARAEAAERERDRAVADFIDGHAKRRCEAHGEAWDRDDESAEEWASDIHDMLNADSATWKRGDSGARDRLSAELAKLRAELAELRARPVLTYVALSKAWHKAIDTVGNGCGVSDIMSALGGPVTLPTPDRAEELLRSFDAGVESLDVSNLTDDEFEQGRLASMRAALASLGTPPTSPPAARPVFAGVSVEELVVQYLMAGDPGLDPGVARSMVSGPRRAGVAAVLARLEVSLVAPVDPEKFARNAYNSRRGPLAWDGVLTAEGRKALADEARHALTAAGIPVTPEVGK